MICPYCKQNRDEGQMPLEITMMIAENMVDAVCESQIHSASISKPSMVARKHAIVKRRESLDR
jgi:hypothetical protein